MARDKSLADLFLDVKEKFFYRIYLRASFPSSRVVVWSSSGGGDYLWLRADTSSPTPGLRAARGIPSVSTQFLEIDQIPTPDATHRSPGVSLAGSSRAFSFHLHGPLSQTA